MGVFSKRPVADVEALPEKGSTSGNDSEGYLHDGSAVPSESFVVGDGWVSKLQRIAGRLGVEQRGIERVPENERTDSSMSSIGTLV